MAQRETIKRFALIAILVFCVLLIVVIWANGISESALSQPGYYRNTAPSDGSLYLTHIAEYENEALGTPAPEREHQEGGRTGTGPENHAGTPTPTITPDTRKEDQ